MTNIPEQVKTALSLLSDAGFEAYIVGGCVRDYLLGRVPNDYDITTSALPEQTQAVFRGYKCIDVGIQHGTVAVIIDKMQLEITTYRIDGEYTDKRHPESVTFSSELRDDLSRRDFTVNALACSRAGEIVDCFSGREDLDRKIIRCVGEAQKRFDEDALRIMRAVRFASQLGFTIAPDTEEQIFALKDTLKMISAERLRAELDKLVCGKAACEILMKYREIPEVFIPEIGRAAVLTADYSGKSLNVWEHTAESLKNSEKNIIIRLTMLFHDLALPECNDRSIPEKGHFSEHALSGAKMAADILKRLKYDNKTIKAVTTLVKYHDFRFTTRQDIKRVMSAIGTELFHQLLKVQKACGETDNDLEAARTESCDITDKKECLSIKELATDGNELKKHGCKGAQIGEVLSALLDAVLDDRIENSSEALLGYADRYLSEK